MSTTTARQRRQQAREAHMAYMAACPTRKLLEILDDKWVTVTLMALSSASQRHSDLGRVVAGASQKMLTHTLRQLERDGLVTREVTVSVPVRVDYALTPLGRSLLPLIAEMRNWADGRFAAVEQARADYDRRTNAA